MLKDRNFLSSAILFATGLIFCIAFYNNPVHDYGNYYFGSKLALGGTSIRDIYEPYKFNQLIRELPGMGGQLFFENYAVVPPFTLIFYIPFTFFDVLVSKFIFNVASVFLFSFLLLKLLKHLQVKSKYVLLIPVLLIIPFRNNILFGQTYLLITSMMMAGFLAEEKKKFVVASILYSLAIVLKISPAILLFYFLARKNFRLAIMTVLFSSAFFLLAVWFTGWNFMAEYIFHYIPRMAVNEINNPFSTTYQSASVLLRNIFVRDELLNPASTFNSFSAFSLFKGLVTGILFFFFGMKLKTKEDRFSLFSFTLASSLVLTAYTSSYSLLFLLPVCIQALRPGQRKMMIVMIIVLLICEVPVQFFNGFPLIFRFPRLYLLLILFFVLALPMKIALKYLPWFVLSILFFISIGFARSGSSNKESSYFLDREVSLLTCDFHFEGKELVVETLEADGIHEKRFPLVDTVSIVQNLELKNNQVFYSRQLTTGNDHKLKPVLVNGREIIYLSDKGRGIGFYALRKIHVVTEK